ncbi:glycosyltransferase family 4 protein [Mycobacterium sp. IDR2000157661]|uniref:glycosyltransferase family 4 protein n=1 Tax=Mycobacterium sp. IDR2000157661 TaxID=2867005 RepID=UPI001EEB61A7|nr:glycosyltransferase family 4 protein [Mycobacterium sp. IDR2000157661]ULE33464.1 glycosyltransferase family 4 protein [Mycobacterium sp. IDR2000157661]
MDYGGTEILIADLANCLVARGHNVVVLGAGRSTTNARFIAVAPEAIPERLGQVRPEIVHAIQVRRVIERLARLDGLDIVHDHTMSGALNAPTYEGLGVRTVSTVHAVVDADMHRYYSALDGDLGLIAISNRQRVLAPDLNWIRTVHHGLGVADWPFRSTKDDFALFLGRFCAEKAPHLALTAARAAGVPAVLAGAFVEPTDRPYFDQQVRPLLGERDRVIGPIGGTAKRELLAAARCLLFPIRWEEPFGLVMIEAMVTGTPVVALRAGSVGEVIADGETGYVCDEPSELAAALEAIGDIDPHACRAHVENHFSLERMVDDYEEVYASVMVSSGDNA